MPVIVVRPVGMFRAKFEGIEACKNPNYFNLLISPQYDVSGDFKPEKYLHNAEDADKFKYLQAGKDYYFKAAVGINSASNKDGKSYPARINLKIIEVKEVA